MAKDFITIYPAQVRKLGERSSPAVIARTTEKAAVIARALAPGSMKEHIRVIVSATGGGLGIVMCDHPAATFVLFPTKPHDIKARKKGGYLKFQINGGSDIFVGPSPGRVVHHPGNQHPNNFLLKGLEGAKF